MSSDDRAYQHRVQLLAKQGPRDCQEFLDLHLFASEARH